MHRNARLTVWGRQELVRRVHAGRPAAHVAAEMGVSRATAYKWLRRFDEEGDAGFPDRSSRPQRSPARTPIAVEMTICALRRARKFGPARIGYELEIAPSTVHRVLARHGISRLAWMDRPTGRVIRRYERERPGELVHVDIKKLGRLRDGGGWRAHGRENRDGNRRRPRVGYEYVHSAVDDRSRLAYSEILPDERGTSCARFLERAIRFYRDHNITVERVLTDNAFAYRNSDAFHRVLDEHGIGHRLIQPYRPQTNGKVERYNRTLLDEWAYASVFRSGDERAAALTTWLDEYNYTRPHHSLAGKPPASRVNNVPGHYT
jgi:transposase InsO family protein